MWWSQWKVRCDRAESVFDVNNKDVNDEVGASGRNFGKNELGKAIDLDSLCPATELEFDCASDASENGKQSTYH